ncbi:hypothetical protein WJ542_29350 [Paraburkholderia sp. B3]|uniref:hypothetical protein n=1 Tax=Paraburkholderia sp. B3 TaxID=3134791 RepID=UPI0039824D15
MTAPRKLDGVTLKPRVKIRPRRKIDIAAPEGKRDTRDILRQVVEEHREVIEHLPDR